MNVRLTPVQDLPENQDPEFAYIIDEQTGVRTPLPGGPLMREQGSVIEEEPEPVEEAAADETPAPKKRGRPRKEVGTVVEPEPEADPEPEA